MMGKSFTSTSPASGFVTPGLFALGLAVLPLSASAATWAFTGKAVSPGGEELYEERHRIEGQCSEGHWRPQSQEVLYIRPGEKKEFATKTLDYSESALRPSFVLEQPEWDESMEVTNHNNEYLTINWQTNEGGIENYRVPLEGTVVVDSGFDNFVRQQWSRMNAGESSDFQFLAPTRGEHYPFVLEPASDNRVDGAEVLRIRPTGLVMRFVVEPLQLAYNDKGMLVEYFGITNIRRDSDNNYTAHIAYSHEQTPDCSLVP